ncbi:MAG TPA: peptidylprolyl isomerase [Gemmataceae bacterium]|jgi:hypothetical protein|nr:peptidylprolyl isomerase [Gemmataceae bacterium]
MRPLFRRSRQLLGAAALLSAGYVFGHLTPTDPVAAQPGAVAPASASVPAAADKKLVAYVFGNVPITREEFGEYLINIYGKDKVRLFVNQRVIEMTAAKAGVTVTPQEVEAVIEDDCKKLSMTKGDFEKNVLKQRYATNLQGWRENSIRPRLMLQKMCQGQVKFEEADLKKVYENLYGEHVLCKVILWPADQGKEAFKRYEAIRASDAEFDQAARSQPSSQLAARGGQIDPIGRHSGPGTAKIEEIAFSIKDGQVSELIPTPGGILVIKRLKSIPGRTDVSYDSVRDQLIKELTDRQMEQLVPQYFTRLNEQAKPLFLLSPADETKKDLENQSERLLHTTPEAAEKK